MNKNTKQKRMAIEFRKRAKTQPLSIGARQRQKRSEKAWGKVACLTYKD